LASIIIAINLSVARKSNYTGPMNAVVKLYVYVCSTRFLVSQTGGWSFNKSVSNLAKLTWWHTH